jgi:hypothetical protein
MSTALVPVLVDRDEIARRVVVTFRSACVKLAQCKPLIEKLWRAFEELGPGETIMGCRTKKAFCEQYLNRSPRAVRYLLYGRTESTAKTLGAEDDAGGEQCSPVRQYEEPDPILVTVLRFLNDANRAECFEGYRELRDRSDMLTLRLKERLTPVLEADLRETGLRVLTIEASQT